VRPQGSANRYFKKKSILTEIIGAQHIPCRYCRFQYSKSWGKNELACGGRKVIDTFQKDYISYGRRIGYKGTKTQVCGVSKQRETG